MPRDRKVAGGAYDALPIVPACLPASRGGHRHMQHCNMAGRQRYDIAENI